MNDDARKEVARKKEEANSKFEKRDLASSALTGPPEKPNPVWRKQEAQRLVLTRGLTTFDDIMPATWDLDAVIGRSLQFIRVRSFDADWIMLDICLSQLGIDPRRFELDLEAGKPFALTVSANVTYAPGEGEHAGKAILDFTPSPL